MFTGIVEEKGKIKSVSPSRIVVEASKILEDVHIGDSIAVNGVCLTVIEFTKSSITLDVMNETYERTNLRLIKGGAMVNLERAMAANSRFGGHIVSGHIDGTGTVSRIEKDGIAIWYTIKTSSDILKGIVMKGSVALDGISLTVAGVDDESFKVSVIPHTQSVTTLLNKKAGDIINIENDIIGKYVERLMSFTSKEEKKGSSIDLDFLMKNGF